MNPRDNRDSAFDGIDKQFHQASLRERLTLLLTGLRAPRESREHKLAAIEVQRLAAPAAAVLVPLIAVAVVAIFALTPKTEKVEWIYPFDNTPVEETRDLIRTDPVTTPTDEQKFDNSELPPVDNPTPEAGAEIPNTPPSPPFGVEAPPIPGFSDSKFRTGIVTKLPPGGPKKGPGPDGGGGPTIVTENAVMRGLRWLKLNQNPDGSWSANKPAMTGLALLAFLAHDERPGVSPEFGDTVQRGIEYLLATYNGRSFAGSDGNEYAHLIAAYALCEAYGMTQNPNIRHTAQYATRRIIEGQQPGGGWDYKLAPGNDRSDTSYMGWAAQSLRAAQLAKIFAGDPEWSAKLDRACKLSVNGFLKNGAPGGGFGYTGPDKKGLTAVGVLCMQYHGAAGHRQVTDSLKLMAAWQPGWFATERDTARLGIGRSVQYYYYYATQAMYLAGGKPWRDWNDAMVKTYERAQKIQRAAIACPDGVLRDIGWWENADAHSDRPVMDTCLAALQLEVYYRYLPTYQPLNVLDRPTVLDTSDDVVIDIKL